MLRITLFLSLLVASSAIAQNRVNLGPTNAQVTGVLGVANGGTGLTSLPCLTGTPAAGDLSYFTGVGVAPCSYNQALLTSASGSTGAYLRSAGSAAAPIWSTLLLPNSATAGDIPYSAGTNSYSNLAKGTALQQLRMNAGATAPEWATISSSAALSGITAATGANTIANGNNTGQVWNWANTTNTTVAFTFGETSAATNGTSTSNVPNQVLAKFATLAASTQSPWAAYSRGTFVAAVSPDTAQFLAGTSGPADCTAPGFSFTTNKGTGIQAFGNNIQICTNGSYIFTGGAGQANFPSGNSITPGISNLSTGASGLAFDIVAANNLSLIFNSAEYVRFNAGGHPNSVAQTPNTPTVGGSACGTSPAITGTDDNLKVTVGTGGVATVCTIGFGTTWVASTVNCTSPINNTDIVPYKMSVTTTGITITATAPFTAGSTLTTTCRGII